MKTNQLNETKERKSFKEVLVENKEVILIGTGIVISGIGAYFLGKELVNKRRLETAIKKLNDDSSKLGVLSSMLTVDNTDRLDKIENVLFQGGVLEQAEATIHRKKNRLVDKLARYVNAQGSPETDKIIKECEAGIESFNKMLDGCDFIRFCCKNETIEELIKED